MDEALKELRRDQGIRLLIPVFLMSGATSLVYESIWARQLHVIFGTSQLAIATVLAAFMAGLAGGGFLGARFADRVARPVLVYGILEAGIGLYALVFPLLTEAVGPIYRSAWSTLSGTPTLFGAVQFGVLGLVLLPPTMCMGATLPLLSRFVATRADKTGSAISMLYGANTIGAVVGTALAGLVLLPNLGLALTTGLTAAMNMVLAGLAVALSWRSGEKAGPLPTLTPIKPPVLLLALAALAGFTALLYEVAWFRLLTLILGASAYAFTIMLLGFLLGIGVGGWMGGPIVDRIHAKRGLRGVLMTLAGIQGGVALFAWAAMYGYGELPFLFTRIYGVLMEQMAPQFLWPSKLLLSLLVMLPPTFLMGVTFPFLVRAAAGDSLQLGRPVGQLYGFNTVGGILGAGVGGLVLLPLLHVQGAVLLGVTGNLIAALLAVLSAERTRPAISWQHVSAFAVAALWITVLIHWKKPPWDPLIMTAGMYQYASDIDGYDRESVLDFAVRPYELLFYEEGLSSVVTVARSTNSDNMWLANNGKVDASTTVDMPTQLLVAHLPFFVHQGTPENVLVVGLASGITAGAATLHDPPTNFDIVELEPAVVEASRLFDDHNFRPLADPRSNLIANDGRNHLYLTPDAHYDIIICEPSNPWLTGVSNLFTREFFALGKKKLKPGGVWSQWVQLYGMGEEDLKSLVGTFSDTYNHVLLFSTIRDADLVMIASDTPIDATAEALKVAFHEPDVAETLEIIEINDAVDLLARLQHERAGLQAMSEGVERNTDDNMRIEYSAPLHLHELTSGINYRLIEKSAQPPLHLISGLDQHMTLAEAYGEREDWIKALLTLKAANQITPGAPDIEELYNQYQAALNEQLEEQDGAAALAP